MEENTSHLPDNQTPKLPAPAPIAKRRTPAWMPLPLLALSLLAPFLISDFSGAVVKWFGHSDIDSISNAVYWSFNISFAVLQTTNAVLDAFFIKEAMSSNRRPFMYLAGFSFVISATLTCLIALAAIAFFWHQLRG